MTKFSIPTVVPISFGVEVPTGNLNYQDYYHAMRRFGGEYEFHAVVMKHIHANYEGVKEVVNNIRVKKLKTTDIHAECDTQRCSTVYKGMSN